MQELTHSPMPSGNLPFISVENVRAALEAMIHNASDGDALNPIYFLLLVDELLTDPDLPSSSHLRVFLANQFLIDLITSEFAAHRNVFDLPTTHESETRAAALQAIKKDALQGSTELLGWSNVYYRYVRVNLALTPDEISNACALHERSLRRYHQRILERITEKLIEAERQTRSRQRKRRLFARLPEVTALKLIGRDEIIDQMRHVLSNGGYHVYVTGAGGIGKTSLVQEAVRWQIETEQIDHLYWIDSPLSAQFVYEKIIQEAFPEGSRISLREYLLIWRIAIVLDNAEGLFSDLVALHEFLEYFSPAFVYISSRNYQPLSNVDVHIQLPPLTQTHTEELAHYLAVSEIDELDAVWERTNGNPFAVRMLMRNSAYFETHKDDIVQRLLMTTYNTLTPDIKLNFLMLLLSPPEKSEISHLERLWKKQFSFSHLMILVQLQLVDMPSPDFLCIPTNVRAFVESFVQRNAEDMMLFRLLIDELENSFQQYPVEALPFVEHILLSNWLTLAEERRERWAVTFTEEGVTQGHWATWRAILEALSSKNPLLYIYYGICLRRLGEWGMAENALTTAIAEAGYKGLFVEQAQASLELAVLLRYQGEYDRAVEEIKRAERTAINYKDTRLSNKAKIELAQIAIDVGDGLLAQQFLEALPPTIRVLSLRSEASLLQKDLEKSLEYAKHALLLAGQEKSTTGRIYALLGRIYDAKNDLNVARRYLSLAVTFLEQAHDVFALARAESNLAVLFMRRNVIREAEQLLLRAEKTHLMLGDRVALKTTQHNLQIVRLKLAGG